VQVHSRRQVVTDHHQPTKPSDRLTIDPQRHSNMGSKLEALRNLGQLTLLKFTWNEFADAFFPSPYKDFSGSDFFRARGCGRRCRCASCCLLRSSSIGIVTIVPYRTVPLGPLVLKELREWKLAGPKGKLGLVFPTPSGDGVALHNNTVRAFTAAVRAAGLTDADGAPKYSGLHALRHFYASWCINAPERGGQGLAPKVVQQRLGHSSILMTMDTYGHLFPPEKDAHEKLADADVRCLRTRHKRDMRPVGAPAKGPKPLK
jgi:hypothetical protein